MPASPDTIRTFLAVYPDASTLDRVSGMVASFRNRTRAIRWTPDHQLHFTLRFFGDLDLAARRSVVLALDDAGPKLSPVSLSLNGIGAFPNWGRPRVIWVGAGGGGGELETIARRLEDGFVEAGLGRADKPFRAHLTIGRIRDGQKLESGVQQEMERTIFSTPPFRIGTLKLMGSRLGPAGATHTELYEILIGGEA